MSADGGINVVHIAAAWLILLGSAAEVVAVVAAWRAQGLAKKWNEAGSAGDAVSEVLKALIAKLPWMAVMGLTTIVLGMVLLMGRWPWHAS